MQAAAASVTRRHALDLVGVTTVTTDSAISGATAVRAKTVDGRKQQRVRGTLNGRSGLAANPAADEEQRHGLAAADERRQRIPQLKTDRVGDELAFIQQCIDAQPVSRAGQFENRHPGSGWDLDDRGVLVSVASGDAVLGVVVQPLRVE
jgi:hypothetical protein